MELHYLIGDATSPTVQPALICHVCNSCGKWGSGFVLALSKKSSIPEAAYRTWAKDTNNDLPLGESQFVSLPMSRSHHVNYVCNMIAQKGTHPENGVPPIRYDALQKTLENAQKFAKANGLVVAMPRIGAVLAGGDWITIEKIIQDTMLVDTYVYTLESEKGKWPTKYENDSDDVDLNNLFS